DAILNRTPVAPVRLNPGVPAKLEEVIDKALERDREIRCQSAAELRADLKRLKRDTESGKTSTPVPVSTSGVSLRKWQIAGASLMILVLGGMGWFAWHQGGAIESVATSGHSTTLDLKSDGESDLRRGAISRRTVPGLCL